MTPSTRTIINNLKSLGRSKLAPEPEFVLVTAAKGMFSPDTFGKNDMFIHPTDYTSFRAFLMEPETEAYYTRVVATFFIFLVSLFGEAQVIVVTVEPVTDFHMPAVSLPTLSKRSSFLRIPRIIFFIGKHFGTGSFPRQHHSPGI